MTDRATWCAELGRRLAKARTDAGLTLEAAADAIGARRNTVWRWEAGRVAPDSHLLALYCRVLGVEVGAVLP